MDEGLNEEMYEDCLFCYLFVVVVVVVFVVVVVVVVVVEVVVVVVVMVFLLKVLSFLLLIFLGLRECHGQDLSSRVLRLLPLQGEEPSYH